MADDATVDNGGLTDYVVAAKDIGSGRLAQIVVPYQQNRSDAFTAAGNGTTVDVSAAPCKRFTMQAVPVGGTPTAWVILLEGSLDGATFGEIVRHSSANGDQLNDLKMIAIASPVKYFRSRCVSITLNGATNITMYILGEA